MKNYFLLAFLFPVIVLAQKPIFTSAKVKAATVYFNSVEILQTTTVNLPAGNSEIVIKNIANELNENTIQIAAPSNVTVLSVQFSNDYISEYEIDEKNPTIKKVRDSIVLIEKEIKSTQILITSNQQTVSLLDQNKIISGSNTGLNVAELVKLVDYYKLKRNELETTIVTLQEKVTKLNERLQVLKNKLEINVSKEEKSSEGKLILSVMNSVAGNVNLDVNYISNTASWSPFYDLRAISVKDPISIMYKAQVMQNSGIDWKKVKLTLSTGNPNQNNQAPILNSWFLRYGEIYSNFDNSVQNKIQSRALIGHKDSEVVVTSMGIEKKTLSEVVSTVNSLSVENQLNVSFDIDIPYDILSNSKIHSVALKEIELPATYKYYAVPKIDKEAFLLAEIKDYSKYNLLTGEANIIFEGLYVGKTTINPNQTSDTLNLSMGRDKKINIRRDKVVEKSGTKFLSSYKEQTFTYEITVRNNKKEDIFLLLKDQYPLSTDKEIIVQLLEDGKGKVNSETGIVTWELKLNANETRKIRISYLVKYPKDKIIGNL